MSYYRKGEWTVWIDGKGVLQTDCRFSQASNSALKFGSRKAAVYHVMGEYLNGVEKVAEVAKRYKWLIRSPGGVFYEVKTSKKNPCGSTRSNPKIETMTLGQLRSLKRKVVDYDGYTAAQKSDILGRINDRLDKMSPSVTTRKTYPTGRKNPVGKYRVMDSGSMVYDSNDELAAHAYASSIKAQGRKAFVDEDLPSYKSKIKKSTSYPYWGPKVPDRKNPAFHDGTDQRKREGYNASAWISPSRRVYFMKNAHRISTGVPQRNMIKALEMHPWLNSVDDWQRYYDAKWINKMRAAKKL